MACLIEAPLVAVLSVTVCGVVEVPPDGLKVGAKALIVYVAVLTLLLARPATYATALILVVALTVIGVV